MKKVLLLLIVIISVSCKDEIVSPNETKTAELNKPFELKVGESVSLEMGKVNFTFESVPADSRCPTGAICRWAGDATVVIKFSEEFRDSLHTNVGQSGLIADTYYIALLSLSPYPKVSEQIKAEEYIAKFEAHQVILAKKGN
ncbi:MAG: hypothetical protein GXX85_03485 [Ignavibacteria bacterium]|nr:hypothetical protein [Ignavibacteria bacterium]